MTTVTTRVFYEIEVHSLTLFLYRNSLRVDATDIKVRKVSIEADKVMIQGNK
jgi:hypothetical protein